MLTGSNGFDTGPLLTWDARFEIEAGASRVVGTKTLTTRVPPNFGVCAVLENELAPDPPFGAAPIPRTGYSSIADAKLAYAATIITPDGRFRDEGTAESDLRETFVRCCGSDGLGSVSADVGFGEIFDSTQSAPTRLSKDDCKKGGWATLGMGFKNQGDCVSYFATNGKNGPAG